MNLPLGKLPPELLANMLAQAPVTDPRVLVKPGIGLDCAVIDAGDRYLVLKSDPITFATDDIGWYLVQVNSNDIATTGGIPKWLMVTMLLPEGKTTAAMLDKINQQLFEACREKGISLIGGHTEITYGIDRPILSATLIGEVAKDKLITAAGASPGDKILLTKGVPIEATAILSKEFPERFKDVLTAAELESAQKFLFDPGISVSLDAKIATMAGRVTAMHDPTEGGLAGAIWELAEACNQHLEVDVSAIPIPEVAGKICKTLGLNPLETIASGALLMTARPDDVYAIIQALAKNDILCVEIGNVQAGEMGVWQTNGQALNRPQRDEIARFYESVG
ncbi:MAG: hydrogenase expression/formation protein HypE [Cellvibrionaceae bacterium]|jgi:hydrogenase expression/formation protein HypE